jgi:hypothetical protein
MMILVINNELPGYQHHYLAWNGSKDCEPHPTPTGMLDQLNGHKDIPQSTYVASHILDDRLDLGLVESIYHMVLAFLSSLYFFYLYQFSI